MVHEMLRTEDKVIPWIASSKSSDQKIKHHEKLPPGSNQELSDHK